MNVTSVTKSLNAFLLIILIISAFGFLSFANIYGLFLAVITSVIAAGIFRRNRWAYFASAAWALACYQLAKQGYEFEIIKSWVMTLAFFVIGLSIYLHEKLGRKSTQDCEKSSNNQ